MEYSTKEFVAKLQKDGYKITYRTLQMWRVSRDGNPPKFPAGRYERKGRIAIYLDSQLDDIKTLLKKKSSPVDTELTNPPTNSEIISVTPAPMDATLTIAETDTQKVVANTDALCNTETVNQTAESDSINPADSDKKIVTNSYTPQDTHKTNTPSLESVDNVTAQPPIPPSTLPSVDPPDTDKKNIADTSGETQELNNNVQIVHGKNTTGAEISQVATVNSVQIFDKTNRTILENLPDELLNQKRFFPVRITKDGRKIPRIKAWQEPNNQMTAQEAIKETGLIGMDICGHGIAPDYFFIDIDHIKDQNGNFLYKDAERWVNYLSTAETFCEKSIRKDGLHYLFCTTPNLFPTLTGDQSNHAIYFDETKKGKDSPKIELFHCSGRYILLTGDSEPNTKIISGEEADEFCQQLCNQLSFDTSQIKDTADAPTNSNISIEEVKKMLAFIDCKNVSYADWFKIGAILHFHFGSAGFELWHAWSETDKARYTLKACQKQWSYISKRSALKIGRPATIGSLIFFAKKFGYQPPKKKIEINATDSIEEIQAKIRKMCEWAHDKNGYPTKIKPTVKNYKLIFNNDPNLKGLFGRDDFRQEIVFKRRAPWHSKNAPLKDSWDDTDDAELRLYLAEFYAEMPNLQRTLDYTTRVAGENSFHAIKQFFDALPTWDGTARMETFFCKFLGADDTAYTRTVTKHFLLGAIARAFYPGCDFQSVPVLQGAQGIGKSRALRMLGGKHGVNPKGENWHIALRDQLDDSHAVDAMRKGWIVEIEEFAAGSRADVNAMKGVLSADDITRRFAYDRRAKTVKSHWVFIATCNDDTPLRDQTGARRFLPIKCHNKESTIVEGMTPEYIQQIWAEAYHTFKAMFPTVDSFDADKLRLPTEIQKQAAEKAAGITQDDGMTNEIKGFLDTKILPPVIWYLLSREERRKFHVNGGCLIMKNAIAELDFRRRARGGNPDKVQKDIDFINDYINSAGKNENGEMTIWVEEIYRGENNPPDKIYHINGTETRNRICQGEIFNECFGADNRKRMNRISEILSHLEGWHLGERLQKIDPAYPDQRKPYYRN